ncbi:MAG TPA: P-loop NTPase fold protein [Pseudonocardiaceae bacterium]
MPAHDRVVPVYDDGTTSGSGFLLTDEVLLTAAGAVRPGGYVLVAGRACSIQEFDTDPSGSMSLCRLDDRTVTAGVALEPVRFGVVIGERPLPAEVTSALPAHAAGEHQVATGRLLPLSGRKASEVVVELDRPGGVLREGLAGAPIRCGDLLVGLATDVGGPGRVRGPAVSALLAWLPPWLLGEPPVPEAVELADALYRPVAPADRRTAAALLDPWAAVVPFTGRRTEFNDLRLWATTASQPPVMWLTAPAGHGKTRLALELVNQLGRDAQLAGFLRPGAALSPLSRHLTRDVLVVVDRADVRGLQLGELLRLVSTGRTRVKVLVLEREPQPDRPGDLRLALAPLSDAERRRHLALAHDAFVHAVPLPEEVAPAEPDLREPGYGSVLAVHEAALRPFLDRLPDAPPSAPPTPVVPPPPETDPGAAGLGTRGFGDRPAGRDLLQRQAMIDALAELLTDSSADERGDDHCGPTVVAVEGPWGSGKTTVMDLVRERIEETAPAPEKRKPPRRLRVREAYRALGATSARDGVWRPDLAAAPRVLTARFEPWSHQSGEQVWAGLARALIEAGTPVVGWHRQVRERYWFARNLSRLDARAVQKALWGRIVSPLLKVAVFALLAPVVAQLARATDTTYTVGGLGLTGNNLAWLLPVVLLVAGTLHTLGNYLFRPAAHVLPAELFAKPVISGALAPGMSRAADTALEDPYYRARSGYLYFSQHDVFEVLGDLKEAGCQVVVFVDDLDRCSPGTTAQVFEAINVFLTKCFPTTRFVIGLDAVAVVAHLDDTYRALSARAGVRTEADPTSGWSFLRKLVQLQVVIPPMRPAQVAPLLRDLLGETGPAVATAATGGSTAPRATTSGAITGGAVTAAVPPTATAAAARAAMPTAATTPTGAEEPPPTQLPTLERSPEVRRRLVDRLSDRTGLSGRETKRLLTTWQFLVRVAELVEPLSGPDAVGRARDLVLLAEVVVRWPAAQRALLGRHDGEPGLARLAKHVDDDVDWAVATREVGLHGEEHRRCRDELRKLLRTHPDVALGELAARLT